MVSKLWKGQSFSVSHSDGTGTTLGGFEGGLRSFFEYRDLGIKSATGGKFVAHVIRAVPGKHTEPQWHTHNTLVYICLITNKVSLNRSKKFNTIKEP